MLVSSQSIIKNAFDRLGAYRRMVQIVALLRTRDVCDGWKIDNDLADSALGYLKKLAAGEFSEDQAVDQIPVLIRFCDAHNQSLDWVLLGDPAVMICESASRSERAKRAAA
jgi:hypothetical protein